MNLFKIMIVEAGNQKQDIQSYKRDQNNVEHVRGTGGSIE